ncbi:MAG: 50S ribosomal protein L20 [Phycisphaerae bacterium]|nr:50S ribosomal protein L20 [Phycisphaerae bacterium]
MPRVRAGASRQHKHKRIKRQVKGQYGIRKSSWRHVKQANLRTRTQRRKGLKLKKRDYRALWITRLSAACRLRGIRYSQFIAGLIKAGIELNRKMLSELAIVDPPAFDAVCDQAKTALA